jgi:hypothetical protein
VLETAVQGLLFGIFAPLPYYELYILWKKTLVKVRKNCSCAYLIRHYTMKAYGGSGCTNLHFLDLGTSWRRVVRIMPRPFYRRGKRPQYPLDRRLGGPQSRSGRHEEVNILNPTGTRTPNPRSSSQQPSPVLTGPSSCPVPAFAWKAPVRTVQSPG